MTRATTMLVTLVLGCGTLACRGTATGTEAGGVANNPGAGAATTAGPQPATAADDRLQITLEIKPDVVEDDVPLRTAVLHFRNVGTAPVRFYLPNGEAFRLSISTLRFAPEGAPPLLVPEPHPHGYMVTEADFHLLEPGAEASFDQPFTIDPFRPGGRGPARLAGFEAGKTVSVTWSYENSITRWEGGAQTLDGITAPLFGGEEIPHIWTGELVVRTDWLVPE